VVLSLLLGLAAGLFFGESVAFLQNVGKAFILLLQMTVLPYIVLALITGLGRLTYQQVATLALRVGGILVLSWVLAFAAILLMPLTFPVWESASFFSTSLLETPEPVNFVTLFIPSNPFFALSNNLVPAVVLFSVAVGVALIGVEPKHNLLESLGVLNRAMTLVTQFVSRLTPLGVFGIVASAAGTMGVEELQRLQVYLFTYVAMALLLTLWVLPALITSLTVTDLPARHWADPGHPHHCLCDRQCADRPTAVDRAQQRTVATRDIGHRRGSEYGRCHSARVYQLSQDRHALAHEFCALCRLVRRRHRTRHFLSHIRRPGAGELLWQHQCGHAALDG
jgi:hypothetical protein